MINKEYYEKLVKFDEANEHLLKPLDIENPVDDLNRTYVIYSNVSFLALKYNMKGDEKKAKLYYTMKDIAKMRMSALQTLIRANESKEEAND